MPTTVPPSSKSPAALLDDSRASASVWELLSSIRTTAVILGIAGLYITVAAFVPQGLTTRELNKALAYDEAQLVQALELDHVLDSWFLLLCGLFLVFNLTGLVLRNLVDRRRGVVPEQHVQRAVQQSPIELAVDVETACRRLRGGLCRVRPASGGFVLDLGLRVESLILVFIGMITVMSVSLVAGQSGFEARVEHQPMSPDQAADQTQRSWVRHGDHWLSESLGLRVVCESPDPADKARHHRCEFSDTTGQTQRLDLRAGRAGDALGLRVELQQERVVSGAADKTRLLIDTGEGVSQLAVNNGGTYVLADGTRITPHWGPDGPFIIAQSRAGDPVLMGPVDAGFAAPVPGGPKLMAIPSWERRIGVRKTTRQIALFTGLGLIVLGFLQLALVPSGRARIQATDTGACLTMVSTLHPRLVQRLVRRARGAL